MWSVDSAVRTKVGWVINGLFHAGNNSKSKSDCSAVTAIRISIEHLKEMLVKDYNNGFNENH